MTPQGQRVHKPKTNKPKRKQASALDAVSGAIESLRLRSLLLGSIVSAKLPKPVARVLLATVNKLRAALRPAGAAHKETSSREVNLGPLSVDIQAAGRRLKSDLRDDWFPDPLNYSDILSGDTLANIVRENVRSNAGRYVPTFRTLFNIPKPGFTLRYALETGLPDRALYHSLAGHLLPLYDRLIPWNSFSHRYDYEKKRSRDRYTFKPGIDSWKHFIGSTKSALAPGAYLVSTDVANFFEHIQLGLLRQRMEELAPVDPASPQRLGELKRYISLLFEYLEYWSYERGRGLPQNRDASSFLANLYMRDVDIAMVDSGHQDTYFRYMDDIKIVCDDEYQARKALKDLSIELRKVGLTLNARKTQIVPASDWRAIDECLDEGSDTIQQIDELWRRRTRAAIFRLWPILRDRTLDLVAKGEVDCREFRYCVKRIALLARFRDLHFPSPLYSPVTSAISNAVSTHPACTDQYVEYLASVNVNAADLAPVIEYVADSDRSIYTWQNYRLWLLFAEKKIKSDKLQSAAMAAVMGPDTPARAGASIYLGAIGSSAGKKLISERFPDLGSYLGQRAALVALHEEPFREVRERLAGVREDLRGVYRSLGTSSLRGVYFQPREEITIELGRLEEASYE